MKAGLLTLVLCALSASALVVTPTVGRTAVCAGKLSLHAHHIPDQEASAPTPCNEPLALQTRLCERASQMERLALLEHVWCGAVASLPPGAAAPLQLARAVRMQEGAKKKKAAKKEKAPEEETAAEVCAPKCDRRAQKRPVEA